uniref:Uncharacterized protein n=1 Tax=viral metagenome TaxID=1070528 RepID=A0A6M3JXE5_9ZZZZ
MKGRIKRLTIEYYDHDAKSMKTFDEQDDVEIIAVILKREECHHCRYLRFYKDTLKTLAVSGIR